MSPRTIIFLVSFSIEIPQNRGRQYYSTFLPLVQLSQRHPNCDFIFPNDRSQQQQQKSRPKTYSDPISFLGHPDWKMNMREVEEGMITRHIKVQKFSFGGTHWINDFREQVFICFYLLIRWAGLFQMRLGTIDNRAQRILDHNGNNGHGLGTITNSRIPLAALLAFCSLLKSISIPASNSNTYTPHRYLSVSHPHNLSLLSAAGSTFFSWSGVTLWSMLYLSSVLSNLTFFTRCIISHFIRLRERKKETIFFSVYNVLLMFLLLFNNGVALCLLCLLVYMLFALWYGPLPATRYLFFLSFWFGLYVWYDGYAPNSLITESYPESDQRSTSI